MFGIDKFFQFIFIFTFFICYVKYICPRCVGQKRFRYAAGITTSNLSGLKQWGFPSCSAFVMGWQRGSAHHGPSGTQAHKCSISTCFFSVTMAHKRQCVNLHTDYHYLDLKVTYVYLNRTHLTPVSKKAKSEIFPCVREISSVHHSLRDYHSVHVCMREWNSSWMEICSLHSIEMIYTQRLLIYNFIIIKKLKQNKPF